MKRTLVVGDESHELEIRRNRGRVVMVWDDQEIPVDIVRVEPTSFSVIIDNQSMGVNLDRTPAPEDPDLHGFRASLFDGAYEFTLQDPHKRLLAEAMARSPQSKGGLVKALMPGKLVKLLVKEGEKVEEGQPLLILEAMKMQNEYSSPMDGVVSKLHALEGANLDIHAPMISLEPLAEAPAQS